MTRLKTLGVALVAVFAMSAVVASAASAQGQGMITSDGPVTLIGTENTPNKLTAFEGDTTCENSKLTGHELGSKTKGVPSGATSATFTPDYGPCKTTLGGTTFPTTVDMNGCDYVFHVGQTTDAEHTYGVTATVVCNNVGEHIQVTLFSSSSHALRVCTLTVTVPAGGVSGPHITSNTAAHDLDVKGTFTGFTVHKTGLCGGAEDKNGQFDIDGTVKGVNSLGEPTGVTITDKVG